MRFAAASLVLLAGQAFADYDNHTDFVQTCNENGFASESYTVFRMMATFISYTEYQERLVKQQRINLLCS